MRNSRLALLALPVLTLSFVHCMRSDKNAVPGIEVSNLDTTVSPGNDFYQYACGGWMKKFPLPGEYSRYGSFDKLGEDNQKMVKSLVEELASKPGKEGSLEYKVGTFYTLGMDSAAIEKDGLKSIQADIQFIEKISSTTEIVKEVARQHQIGGNALFNLYAAPDDKNSAVNIAIVYQGGLGLPDRDYYTATDANTVKIRTEYQVHISKMFQLAGNDKATADKRAASAMFVETEIAKASRTRVELRDPQRNYNKMKFEELVKIAPEFDWKAYFSSIGVANLNELNVSQPDFLAKVSKMMTSIALDKWKDYLSWSFIHLSSPYLTTAFVDQNFEFYGKILSGKTVQQPRWKRVINATNDALGEAVGEMYVKKYFPAKAKERMLSLVENLRIAMGERISALTWMSDVTKEKAKEKLAAIKVKIGYPDKWRDYNNLEVKKDAYILNVFRSNAFNFNFSISKIGQPIDPTEWLMTPQTVNAYYNPTTNEICFPAAILQPPFFNLNADDAVNYGAIGVVIGHEMTHGFDDQGRQYDKVGNLSDWWLADDAAKFKTLADGLANQYSSITVLDSVKANGKLTLGENIADQGGLNIAYTALQKALKSHPQNGKIDGFTSDQRFFLAYSTVWASNIRNEEILRRTREDEHSLGKWRVNAALKNITKFYEAFNIKEGDPMYLPVDKRVNIW